MMSVVWSSNNLSIEITVNIMLYCMISSSCDTDLRSDTHNTSSILTRRMSIADRMITILHLNSIFHINGSISSFVFSITKECHHYYDNNNDHNYKDSCYYANSNVEYCVREKNNITSWTFKRFLIKIRENPLIFLDQGT